MRGPLFDVQVFEVETFSSFESGKIMEIKSKTNGGLALIGENHLCAWTGPEKLCFKLSLIRLDLIKKTLKFSELAYELENNWSILDVSGAEGEFHF